MKKIFNFNDENALIFSVPLFLGGIYLLAKVFYYNKHLPMKFYIALFICFIIIIIIFLIKYLGYNFQQIIKSIVKSLSITLIINFIGFIILYFNSGPIMCAPCLEGYKCHCPTVMENLASGLIYTIPAVFLITLLIYLIVKKLKNN